MYEVSPWDKKVSTNSEYGYLEKLHFGRRAKSWQPV